jgi:hypothetical protein
MRRSPTRAPGVVEEIGGEGRLRRLPGPKPAAERSLFMSVKGSEC